MLSISYIEYVPYVYMYVIYGEQDGGLDSAYSDSQLCTGEKPVHMVGQGVLFYLLEPCKAYVSTTYIHMHAWRSKYLMRPYL